MNGKPGYPNCIKLLQQTSLAPKTTSGRGLRSCARSPRFRRRLELLLRGRRALGFLPVGCRAKTRQDKRMFQGPNFFKAQIFQKFEMKKFGIFQGPNLCSCQWNIEGFFPPKVNQIQRLARKKNLPLKSCVFLGGWFGVMICFQVSFFKKNCSGKRGRPRPQCTYLFICLAYSYRLDIWPSISDNFRNYMEW